MSNQLGPHPMLLLPNTLYQGQSSNALLPTFCQSFLSRSVFRRKLRQFHALYIFLSYVEAVLLEEELYLSRPEWLLVLFTISYRKSAESLAMISSIHRNYSGFTSITS